MIYSYLNLLLYYLLCCKLVSINSYASTIKGSNNCLFIISFFRVTSFLVFFYIWYIVNMRVKDARPLFNVGFNGNLYNCSNVFRCDLNGKSCVYPLKRRGCLSTFMIWIVYLLTNRYARLGENCLALKNLSKYASSIRRILHSPSRKSRNK